MTLDFMADLDAGQRVLADLMSDLSEECWCAGWLHNTEVDVWAMLVGDRDSWGMGLAEAYAPELESIKLMAEQLGVWIVWDGDPVKANMRAVPLTEWEATYAATAKR